MALTVGSRDPRAVRADSDLGRFGLGLKTASFSQARSLTVASRCAGAENAIFRWDLDFIGRVNDWRLLRGPREESDDRIRAIEQLASGTVVLLENLDRVVGLSSPSDRPSQDEFLANIDRVEQLKAATSLAPGLLSTQAVTAKSVTGSTANTRPSGKCSNMEAT